MNITWKIASDWRKLSLKGPRNDLSIQFIFTRRLMKWKEK